MPLEVVIVKKNIIVVSLDFWRRLFEIHH